ncbi:hypothetical protein [Methyloferula stellata]|uniref:hypothetical protein n=1 Tax=Methyloferula stellata TaxID=876270 RepID=UPI001268364E|nr:hypothetical protein [Methyloferula stellata]
MIKVAPAAHQVTTLTGGVSAARAAVQQFLATELGAREIRITKIAPQDHGLDGWAAEAEILVPNLEVKMLGLPLTQEVLECEHYAIELEPDLSVRSYGHLGPESD